MTKLECRHDDPSLILRAVVVPLAVAGQPEKNYILSSAVYSWNIGFGHHLGQVNIEFSVFCNDLSDRISLRLKILGARRTTGN